MVQCEKKKILYSSGLVGNPYLAVLDTAELTIMQCENTVSVSVLAVLGH